ncbi:MAG: penicillin-binding protein 2 [Holosporales bacterium]|jgi:cell division protein FtsI (penicillin-binding protein 3)|nr:penicillin-binding protein 2 [Holosporales bacterium]
MRQFTRKTGGYFREIVGGRYDTISVALVVLRQRILFVLVCFCIVNLAIITRIVYLSFQPQLSDHDRNVIQQQNANLVRADLFDRNGMILATSLPTVSVYANAKDVINIGEAVEGLRKIFKDLNFRKVKQSLESGKRFIWVKRHITPAQQEALLSLGIPGIYFINTERRIYPDRNLLSHVLGFTDVDNIGIAGVEYSENNRIIRNSEPLQLSVDIRLQHALRDELSVGMAEFSATGASGIIYEVETGEVLAMCSLPDFDPNQYAKTPPKNKFNKCTCAVMEPGSTAKIFTTAMALESGRVRLDSIFDVTAPLNIGRHHIKDFHPHNRPLTTEEVFKYSSNIGAARMALQVGGQIQRQFYQDLGMFVPVRLELPELQAPLYSKTWREPTIITVSYGYGIALTPMHMVVGVASILNGGLLLLPTILKGKNADHKATKRIISEATSKKMVRLLRLVVEEGTSRKAEVSGYHVIGKTGTAEKLQGKTYNKNSNMCFFIGAFPTDRPKYLIFIMLDEPKANKNTFGFAAAGWNAAPVASRVIKRIGAILDVVPDKDE